MVKFFQVGHAFEIPGLIRLINGCSCNQIFMFLTCIHEVPAYPDVPLFEWPPSSKEMGY